MTPSPKEAIILAGGMGTRLQSVVSDVPKPMAPVAGRPFLEHLFPMLREANVRRVVLSVGYKSETIMAHFGDRHGGIDIAYAVEPVPLGTGGAIRLAFEQTRMPQVLVLNGDTLFRYDLRKHWEMHRRLGKGALVSVALKEMRDFDRYGTVEVYKNHRIKAFHEKKPMGEGLINAGIYVIDRDLWGMVDVPEQFSFEKDILERHVQRLRFMGCQQEGYFIDIGIPEDYARANRDLAAQQQPEP
ncbi:MAG: D-glycero-alpha-D-manno-heptose 1-phosphate guanylyltransferase [Bacteroidota bacterium]